MAAAYIEEKVTLLPNCPRQPVNIRYFIRDTEDDRMLAMCISKDGIAEWFKHNRSQYIIVDK